MSLCHKLWFSYPNIFATQCRIPLIFETTNYVRPNNLSLKYQRCTPLGFKYKEIRKFELVVKAQFLRDSRLRRVYARSELLVQLLPLSFFSAKVYINEVLEGKTKELSFCHKLWFSNPFFLVLWYFKLLILWA